MKKFLALVMAVAMLSTTAFADVYVGDADADAAADKAGEDYAGNIAGGATSIMTDPDATIKIYPSAFKSKDSGVYVDLDSDTGWRFCTEYFTINTKKFSKGANLVKEVKFNDDDACIDIVLKADTALLTPNSANLVIKDLSVKAKESYNAEKSAETTTGNKKEDFTQAGNIMKNKIYEFNSSKQPNEIFVGYSKGVVDSTEFVQPLNGSPVYVNGRIVKFTDPGKDTAYATASLEDGGDVYMEGRVYKNDKVFVKVDNKVNKEILKLDDTASIRFYNINTNGLPTANVLRITAESTEFCYKIVDDKLVESGLKYSAENNAFEGKIRSSASYVISDKELKAAPATGDKPATTNPDTGANDVVGIAAALAVVSLVAAGAVSMKK